MRWTWAIVALMLVPVGAAQSGDIVLFFSEPTSRVELPAEGGFAVPFQAHWECDPLAVTSVPVNFDVHFEFVGPGLEFNDTEVWEVRGAQCTTFLAAGDYHEGMIAGRVTAEAEGESTQVLTLRAWADPAPSGIDVRDADDSVDFEIPLRADFMSWILRNQYSLEVGEDIPIPVVIENRGNARLTFMFSAESDEGDIDVVRPADVVLEPTRANATNNWTQVQFVARNLDTGWGSETVKIIVTPRSSTSNEAGEPQHFEITLKDAGGSFLDVPSPGGTLPVLTVAAAFLLARRRPGT